MCCVRLRMRAAHVRRAARGGCSSSSARGGRAWPHSSYALMRWRAARAAAAMPMHGHAQPAGGGAVHAQCIGGRATHATLVHLLPFYSTARYCVSSSRITDTEHVHAQFFVYSGAGEYLGRPTDIDNDYGARYWWMIYGTTRHRAARCAHAAHGG
eukprot:COSAG01_NODE_20251_length_963_cov_11.858796_1_plen_155_part_00